MTPNDFKKIHGLSDEEVKYFEYSDRFVKAMNQAINKAYEDLEMLLESIIAYGIPITEITVVLPYVDWGPYHDDLKINFHIGINNSEK